MNLPASDQIGFGWRSHRLALQFLAVLYCDPRQVLEAESAVKRLRAVKAVGAIYLHASPYLVILCVLGRVLLYGVLGLPTEQPMTVADHFLLIVFGLVVGLGFAAGYTIGLTRCYYLPLHWLLLVLNNEGLFTRFHPAQWDHACGMPFHGLDRMLLKYAEAEPELGRPEIERLITDYPSQRGPALRASTVLTARHAAKISDLAALEEVLDQLPEGKKGYLAETASLRDKALAVVRQQRYVDAAARPHFKEQALFVLRAEIEKFHAQVGGFREPLASEFRRAAEAWLKLADQQLSQVQTLRRREPTPTVFRAGDPVARDAEAFVPRLELVGTIEAEMMAGPGCPGLLVCGCRRLGKSTLICNLDGFLPESVMPSIVSMQNPEAFSSEASLAALLAREIRRVYAGAAQISIAPVDLATLFQFLQACNERLTADNRRLLLAIDEFEEIDRRIGTGQISPDLPPTLRESIQRHRRITWLFAGTHHFSQLRNVRWSNYFVSVRTVEVPVFTREETRLLLSEPLKYSRREQARQAIGSHTFGRRFWGEDGMDRIYDEAGGWPHLVQLLADTTVDLCNQRNLDHADAPLLDEAFAKAVVDGDTTLAERMLYRSEEFPEAWSYLAAFRRQPHQPPPTDDDLRLLLERHLLIEPTATGDWKLRVPLMQRWLQERT